MNKMKRMTALLLALLLALSLCACGSANSGVSYKAEEAPMPAPAYAAQNAAYSVSDEAFMEEADYAYEAEYGFSPSETAAGGSRDESGGDTAPSENPDKIIYSSDVTVETTEFDVTIGKVDQLVQTYGGWIEQSSVSGANYYQKSRGNASTRNASYTLRIPSTRFQELMGNLSELGNIPYSHIYTENVTSQYYDSQARLTAYKTQETRLLEMMEIAESVEDVIIIEDRLTELRYQIESIQSRLNNWDRRVSYSTVYLTVQEVREYTPEEKVNPTYGEELAQALKDGLENAGEFLKNLLVLIVELLPVLVILIPLIWLVVWIIRKIIAGSRARRAAKPEKPKRKRGRKNEAEPVQLSAEPMPEEKKEETESV